MPIKTVRNCIFGSPQRGVVQQLKALLVTRDRLVKIRTQLEVPIRECEEFIVESIRKDMMKNCRRTLKARGLGYPARLKTLLMSL